jgi:hypothetical protein
MEAIKGLIVIKWEKSSNHPYQSWVWLQIILKGQIYPPTVVCEVELNCLHIYVHNHYQKEYLTKSCILFLFGRVC